MQTDETRSLTQLTGVDWGAPPENAGSHVQERYTLRRTPLQKLDLAGLNRLLTLDFQEDHLHLIPYCVEKIDHALATQDEDLLEYCRLLVSVLSNEQYAWLKHPELVHQTRTLVERASYALYQANSEAEQTNDSLEYYRALIPNTRMEASLYQKLARLEQRISKIAPKQSEP